MIEQEYKNPKVTISTTINLDLWNEAKRKGIAWNDALEFGIKFMLADKFEMEYTHPVNSFQMKLQRTQNMLQEKCKECENLIIELEKIRGISQEQIETPTITEEMNKEFKK